MDSIFEIQRQTHEEIERFERALYTLLSRPTSTHDHNLQNEHKASQALDRISARVGSLNNTYDDQEARKAELNILSASSQQNDLSEFYSRLVKIQEHHNKYPDAGPVGLDLEIAAFLDEPGQEEEEYEEEDRELVSFISKSFSVQPKLSQPSPFFSLARRGMDGTLTSTLITLLIAI